MNGLGEGKSRGERRWLCAAIFNKQKNRSCECDKSANVNNFSCKYNFFVYLLKWHKKGKHEQNNRKITEKLYRFKHECSWIKKRTESNLYNILHCTWLRKIKMNEQNIKLQKLFIISVKLTRIVALNHIFLFSSPIFPYHSRFFPLRY